MNAKSSIKFYNTLSRQVEEFTPAVPGEVRMYTCGPTVYDYAHIGNFRAYVWEDLLRQFLKHRGFSMTHVMNITDVEDKTIRDSRAAGMELREYTDKFIAAFFEDIDALGIERAEFYPRATDHIEEMVRLIQTLIEKKHTYESAGSIYFKIDTFKDYGKLSNLDASGIQAGARVDSDEYEKDDARDFVLWKARKEDEPSWQTALGDGRPGWHVECSAMSMKYLGNSFDIHTGGVDNIFPHHENEIAQSEAGTNTPFVRTWLHCAHLMVDGQKMSKSRGNFYTLRDLLAKGLSPQAIRYFLLSSHYRKPLNFTLEGVDQAQQALARIHDFAERLEGASSTETRKEIPLAEIVKRHRSEFESALDDDMNTAEALAALFDMIRVVNASLDQDKADPLALKESSEFLDAFRRVFGIVRRQKEELSQEEAALVAARQEARKRKDFAESDRLRDQLLALGIVLEDTPQGVRFKRNS
jgi:cysteinyl-tRNA synthetase